MATIVRFPTKRIAWPARVLAGWVPYAPTPTSIGVCQCGKKAYWVQGGRLRCHACVPTPTRPDRPYVTRGSIAELHKVGSRRAPPLKGIALLASRVPRTATLRKQFVKCGKPGCARLHGPYWYAWWKVEGKTRSAYVGSNKRRRELRAAWGPR